MVERLLRKFSHFSDRVGRSLNLCKVRKRNVPEQEHVHSLHSNSPYMNFSAKQAINLIEYAKSGCTQYSGKLYYAGYHTVVLDGKRYEGQRDPNMRLEGVPYDFGGKTI